MRTNNYLTRINDEQWKDLKRIKELDNRSVNSYNEQRYQVGSIR
jgi:hypothetical protein